MKQILAFLVLAGGLLLTGCTTQSGSGKSGRPPFASWLAQQPPAVQQFFHRLPPQSQYYYVQRGPAGWNAMAQRARHEHWQNDYADRAIDGTWRMIEKIDKHGP
jgi:hypothetical protein